MTVVSVYRVYRERDRGWVQLDDGGMPKGPLRGHLEANPKPRRKHVKGGRQGHVTREAEELEHVILPSSPPMHVQSTENKKMYIDLRKHNIRRSGD